MCSFLQSYYIYTLSNPFEGLFILLFNITLEELGLPIMWLIWLSSLEVNYLVLIPQKGTNDSALNYSSITFKHCR